MDLIVNIYNKNETDFTYNGLAVLMPISCQIEETINGMYRVNIEHPRDQYGKWKHLVRGNIIKCDTPRGTDLFRIFYSLKNINGNIQAVGMHISYDLIDNFVEDIYPTQATGQQALNSLKNGLQYSAPFNFTSDITTINNARWMMNNPIQLLLGKNDNSFVNRWGGEVERNSFNIAMKSRIGADRGVQIRYRKNLLGLELTEDDMDVVTRIFPTALNSNDTVLKLTNKFIDSSHINDYPHPKIRRVHFSDIKVGQDIDGVVPYPSITSARTEMTNRVNKMYANGADLPKFNLKVEFVDLSRTAEYKDLQVLTKVELGDTVKIIHEGYNVDLSLRVTSYLYDCLRKKYDSIELGDKKPDIIQSITDTDINLSALSDRVDNTIMQGTDYNHVSITHDKGFVAKDLNLTRKVEMGGYDGFTTWRSPDGGKTWIQTGGLDTDGNLIANKLSTVGSDTSGTIGTFDDGTGTQRSGFKLARNGQDYFRVASNINGAFSLYNGRKSVMQAIPAQPGSSGLLILSLDDSDVIRSGTTGTTISGLGSRIICDSDGVKFQKNGVPLGITRTFQSGDLPIVENGIIVGYTR